MEKYRRWSPILWIAFMSWVGLCFLLSAQTLKETAKLSVPVTQAIIKIFHLEVKWYNIIHTVLRNSAHLIAFFALALLFSMAAVTTFSLTKKLFRNVYFICIVFSVLSELQKLLVSGRHCSISDMGINIFASTLGVFCVYRATRKYQKEK